MTRSTDPFSRPPSVSLASRSLWNRDSGRMVTGNWPYRSAGERGEVLLDEQRGGHQQDHLLAVLDRLERGAHGDLGLAVADVAADQPVHRHRALHVALDLLHRGELVGSLDERKGVLELGLPRCVRPECVTLRGLACGIQLDELARDLADGPSRAALAGAPVGPTQLVEGGLLPADVSADLVELVHRHEQAVAGLPALAGGVLDDEILAGRAVHGAVDELDVASDAVLLVHDVVSGGQLERIDLLASPRRHARALGPVGGSLSDEIVVGEEDEIEHRQHEPVAELPAPHLHHTCSRVPLNEEASSDPGMSFSANHSTVRWACP